MCACISRTLGKFGARRSDVALYAAARSVRVTSGFCSHHSACALLSASPSPCLYDGLKAAGGLSWWCCMSWAWFMVLFYFLVLGAGVVLAPQCRRKRGDSCGGFEGSG